MPSRVLGEHAKTSHQPSVDYSEPGLPSCVRAAAPRVQVNPLLQSLRCHTVGPQWQREIKLTTVFNDDISRQLMGLMGTCFSDAITLHTSPRPATSQSALMAVLVILQWMIRKRAPSIIHSILPSQDSGIGCCGCSDQHPSCRVSA